ncbi:MAG: nucleotide pyrophosphohydrolase [Agarilytica sp.]
MDLPELQQKLLAFAEARDWEQFQSPKNLAMSISIEAAELMEHFQWLSTEESLTLDHEKHRAAAYELADVFMYTLLMAKRMDIDLLEVTQDKMIINEQRYPANKVKGKSLKHTEYKK